MGGDAVKTELVVIRVDEEVAVNGLEFTILVQLIVKIFVLPVEDEAISREKTNQKKSVENPKVVDYMESTEEEKEHNDAGKTIDVGKSENYMGLRIPDKGPMKETDGTHNVVEELKCHLKILNGLGGSLTITYICINLLALEITNYLKEVVSNLKELSSTSTQS
eukprot:Gb_06625 [translate_table: standard]